MSNGILKIEINGQIGENAEFFNLPLKNITEIHLQMEKMTFINSIGVKNWIIWTGRIPANCKVKIFNSPLMMASQASIVNGFMPQNKFSIESFLAPFLCSNCSGEKMVLLNRGKEFDYANGEAKEWVALPEDITCKKCSEEMEPDFFEAKVFGFLKSS